MKIIATTAFIKIASPKSWFHASHYDFDQWDESAASKSRGGRKGVDQIGMWVTSNPEFARKNYGPKVYEYEHDIKNPYLPPQGKNDWYEEFFVPEVASKFLSAKEMAVMQAGSPSLSRLKTLEKGVTLGEFFYGTKEQKEYGRLYQQNVDYRKVSQKLMRDTEYIPALREYLLSKGHDAIMWPNSNIDISPTDPRHDVAVLLDAKGIRHKSVS